MNDAKSLAANVVSYIVETSNMGCTTEAVELFQKKNIPFAPGKAANAGGVAVSGLEMSQNSMKLSWPKEEVDEKLNRIMKDIHSACVESGRNGNRIDYIKGANIAGFRKVADVMLELGF